MEPMRWSSHRTLHLGGIENWLNIYASNTRIETKISNNNSVMAYAPTEIQFKDAYTIEKTETKAGWNHAQFSEDWMTGYPFEVTDFINSIIAKTQPLSNLDLAIDTTKVMYAAYLSAETGKRIEIPKNFIYRTKKIISLSLVTHRLIAKK